MADLIEKEPLLAKMFPCAAKRQVEEAPAVNRWIPVDGSNLMPVSSNLVILSTRWGTVKLGFYSPSANCFYGVSILNDNAVKFKQGMF